MLAVPFLSVNGSVIAPKPSCNSGLFETASSRRTASGSRNRRTWQPCSHDNRSSLLEAEAESVRTARIACMADHYTVAAKYHDEAYSSLRDLNDLPF